MTEKPAKDPEAKEAQRLKVQRNKNRALHSVKFSDDLEEDYQAWKTWYDMNDNQALRHLVSTHPDLKTKPQNHDN